MGRRVVLAVVERHRDLLIVLGWALGLRVLFALLTSDTYDSDEFVVLSLGHRLAEGAVPYRDFMLFHPPGMVVILSALQPLTSLWWPSARVLVLLVDTTTAALVWRIGLELYGRRGALAAGVLYGASPLALITAVRVGPDPFITMLGVAGLALLVIGQSQRSALLAGACLALAIWFKYPALLFLPIYVLAAPRRALASVVSTVLVTLLLFAPFAPTIHALFQQTVVWQRDRPAVALDQRLRNLALYWLLLNAPAVPALSLIRRPRWPIVGFCLGGAFILSPQVYYHYLLPIVPFAALLAAPVVVRFSRSVRFALLPAALALTVAWAMAVEFGSARMRLGVAAFHLSEIRPVVRLLERSTASGGYVLTDRLEYTYLANRPNLSDYYWNLQRVVSAGYLERRLRGVRVVIVTHGSQSYPSGFLHYLKTQPYSRLDMGSTDVWLLGGVGPKARGA